MSDHESFEERLRALAEDFGRSMQRASEGDLDELAERFGVDADRVRGFADVAGQWLNEHLAGADAFFDQSQDDESGDKDGRSGLTRARKSRARRSRRNRPDPAHIRWTCRPTSRASR